MWIRGAASIAIFLFVVRLIAVLQGWSKNNASGPLTGIIFLAVFGAAAFWGLHTLLAAHR
jgi:hypothetical protein